MNERERIAVEARMRLARGSACALASVVRVDGSSYRAPGARMLVEGQSAAAGSVSGGCLDADVIAWAGRVIAAGSPRLLEYDTRDSAPDDPFGLGTGCFGRIEVLVEPIASADHPAIALPALLDSTQAAGVVAVVVESSAPELPVGARCLATPGRAPDGPLAALASDALAQRRSLWRGTRSAAGAARVFCEWIEPAPRVLICGGGADAVPLARLTVEIGWRVAVVDHRPAYARSDRFPDEATVICGAPATVGELVDDRTAVVLMTHDIAADRAILASIACAQPFYVGVLGSRTRLSALLADGHLAAPLSGRLHAPVGLDIGAATPETIALSVLAEVQAASAGRSGGPLAIARGAAARVADGGSA